MKPTTLCLLLIAITAPAISKAQASSTARTLHVSPAVLANVPAESQFRTITEAARAVNPGDTVVIHGGCYREEIEITRNGTHENPIRFEAAPASNVVITGADTLANLKREPGQDNIYSVEWSRVFIGWNPSRAHPDDDYHKLIGRAEQVMVGGYQLRQVLSRIELARGTFFVDEPAKRLFLWSAGNEKLTDGIDVEASVRSTIWHCKGTFVTVKGVRFRYAANAAQSGAAVIEGQGDVVDDCVFERMNSSGATFAAPSITVRHCVFQDNGQIGFGANRAHNLLMTGCTIQRNNTKGFSRGWEAGGLKIVLSRKAVLEKSRFVENRGAGVWFDIGNEDCEVRNCLIADNEDAGIFYEISYGLHAHDNVICGNGLADSPGAWGAAAGICLSSSPNCVIERNLIVANKEGFNFREQDRTTPRIDGKDGAKEESVWNHDQMMRNNVIAYNREAQTWGWFDTNDERHWPAKMQTHSGEKGTAAEDMAANYSAKDATGQPTGLSLEKLHIVLDNNVYGFAPDDGQKLFCWGVKWKRNAVYSSLAAVVEALNLEQHSVVAPLPFADYVEHDFRLPASSAAFSMRCYPEGDVPGTVLGTGGSVNSAAKNRR